MQILKIGILGAGSWGTALSIVFQQNGHEVTLWSHKKSHITKIQKSKGKNDYLPGVKLNSKSKLFNEIIIIARVSAYFFYRKNGFYPVGKIFSDVTVDSIKMIKKI